MIENSFIMWIIKIYKVGWKIIVIFDDDDCKEYEVFIWVRGYNLVRVDWFIFFSRVSMVYFMVWLVYFLGEMSLGELKYNKIFNDWVFDCLEVWF